MHLIDGKAISARINGESRAEVEKLKARGITPGLAVVLVGENPASQSYVRSKDKTAREIGIHSAKYELPTATPQTELIDLVHRLNADPSVHGILVQSPPPPHIDERAVIESIDPRKDIDGFHPVNIGKLALGDADAFVPCTPLGVQRLLIEADVETRGARVVILGRSMIVGKPMALLLTSKGPGGDATVTIAHSRTRDLPAVCREGDILIAAIGQPEFVRADMVRQGAVVVDVGINRVADADSPKGSRLVGDVAFAEVAPKCSAITPVPGGVGPMTIAMLMQNTIASARRWSGL
jgi:methylenetetrahydrofolate dehydrogenase (NADP+)/methenyltetrahydrofolate cyclohydrolase